MTTHNAAIHSTLRKYKRFALIIFLIPWFIYFFSGLNCGPHTFLPAFVAMVILITEGMTMLGEGARKEWVEMGWWRKFRYISFMLLASSLIIYLLAR